MQFTLKQGFRKEPHPEVVFPETDGRVSEPKFNTQTLSGTAWVRVFPITATDIMFLQCLEHRLDKFAPATGNGVIVASRCLDLPH